MTDFLKVEDVLNQVMLKDGMAVAEFGCGSADFAMSLAKKLPKGKVYALDIQEEKLSALKGRMVSQRVNNIVLVLCDLEMSKGSTLQENSLDVVLIPNVLFQAENKRAILEEAVRILKTGGQLLIIDWLKKGPFSPKQGMINPEELKTISRDLKLSLQKEFAAGDYHFGLLFIK